MKLPFLAHSKSLDQNISSSPPWTWPSCAITKTLSFRASEPKDTTFNSAFLDTQITPPDSFSTFSSSSTSDSIVISDDPNDPVESAIRSLRSDRLFFDPDHSCSLVSVANGVDGKGCLGVKDKETRITTNNNFISTHILPLSRDDTEKQKEKNEIKITDRVKLINKVIYTQTLSRECREKKEEEKEDDVKENKEVYKESEILSMESNNPFEDFRMSMKEMVEAHGLQEWQRLELLDCYLNINGDENHGFIVDAFIDLLVSLSISSTTSTPMSPSSSSNATLSSFDDDDAHG